MEAREVVPRDVHEERSHEIAIPSMWLVAHSIAGQLRAMRTALLLPLGLVGCGVPLWVDEEPDYRTEHFEVFDEVDAPRCSPSLEDDDHYLERLAAAFGVAVPPVQVHVGPVTACPGGASCAREGFRDDGVFVGRIDALFWMHHHEVVHVAAGAVGHPPPFFAEGLAVALTPVGTAYLGARTFDGLVDDFDSDEDYPRAGSLVEFWILRYGLDRVMELYAALERSASDAIVRATFFDVFGERLEDAVAAWADGPPSERDLGAELNGIRACFAPPASFDAMGRIERTLDLPLCADDLVPLGGREQLAFEVPSEGAYALEIEGATVVIDIASCEGAPTAIAVTGGPERTLLMRLPPGRHVIGLFPLESDDARVTLRLMRLAGTPRVCGAIPQLELRDYRDIELYDAASPSAESDAPDFELAPTLDGQLRLSTRVAGARGGICDGLCGTPEHGCEDAPLREGVGGGPPIAVGEGFVVPLRFTRSGTDPALVHLRYEPR